MPKPTLQSRSETYSDHLSAARSVGERNDCAVRAVAAVAGQPYDRVLAMFNAAGRKAGKGTPVRITESVLKDLGLFMTDVHPRHFIDQYPGVHRTALRSVTTHHPDRFPAAWRDGHAYMVFTTGHVLAVVNGVNHDWTRGRALRAWRIVRVLPIEPTNLPTQEPSA